MNRPSTQLLLLMTFAIPTYWPNLVMADTATPTTAGHQHDVARRGQEVMPFSLARATHVFTKTNDGGIQRVLTKRNDPEQLQLIRQHLAVIARRFAAGDFEDPEHIHGKDMPGLPVLRAAKPGELTIRYRDLPNGGEIRFQSDQRHVVDALHAWFDAQLAEHGRDARSGNAPGGEHGDGDAAMPAE